MIFGAILVLIGFYVEFLGAINFNFGTIVLGWILIVAGIAIFLSKVAELLL